MFVAVTKTCFVLILFSKCDKRKCGSVTTCSKKVHVGRQIGVMDGTDTHRPSSETHLHIHIFWSFIIMQKDAAVF